MASWIMHLRIAEKAAEFLSPVSVTNFYVGNLAPDSGTICSDMKTYEPEKRISHWQDLNKNFMFDDFHAKYLSSFTSGYDFYLGYYCHLITDFLWREHIYRPTWSMYRHNYKTEQDFSAEVKKDWYQTDVLFLRQNQHFYPYELIKTISAFGNIYFDYFQVDAIQNKLFELISFYENIIIDEQHNYPFLNMQQADAFVKMTIKRIYNDLFLRNTHSKT